MRRIGSASHFAFPSGAAIALALSTSVAVAQVIDLTDTPSLAQHIDMVPGEEIKVHLRRNAGTPFSWSSAARPKNLIGITEQKPIDRRTAERVVGFQQIQVFSLTAIEIGEVEITFNFGRPRSDPIRAIYLFVTVKAKT